MKIRNIQIREILLPFVVTVALVVLVYDNVMRLNIIQSKHNDIIGKNVDIAGYYSGVNTTLNSFTIEDVVVIIYSSNCDICIEHHNTWKNMPSTRNKRILLLYAAISPQSAENSLYSQLANNATLSHIENGLQLARELNIPSTPFYLYIDKYGIIKDAGWRLRKLNKMYSRVVGKE